MKKRLVIGVGAIVFMLLAGSVYGNTSLSVNLKSCLIVLGGTLISALLGFPLETFGDLLHSLRNIYRREDDAFEGTLQDITKLARIRRSSGPRELNEEGNKTRNTFLRKGIELIADGYARHEIHFILEKEYEFYLARKESQINILNTMAKFSPAFGFLGTIIGLINILHNINDSSQIAKGMSLALLTTLYGLLFTNFIFLPMAKKLSEHVKSEAMLLTIILEGVLDISEGKNPMAISYRLQSYLEANSPGRRSLQEPSTEEDVPAAARHLLGKFAMRKEDVAYKEG